MKKEWLLPLCVSVLALAFALTALFRHDGSGLPAEQGTTSTAQTSPNASDGATCQVKRVTTDQVAFYLAHQLGLEAVEFNYTVPAGVQLTAWLETYIDGELDEELSGHFIDCNGPERGDKPDSGVFSFRRYYPKYASESPSERCRWEFVPCNCGGVKWVNNPFRNLASWGRGPHTDIWDLKLGQTEVVYYHCGETEETQKEGMIGYPGHVDPAKEAEMIEHYDVCVFIKVRFDKARGPARLYISQPGLPHFPDEE